jgi:hypothetical protein
MKPASIRPVTNAAFRLSSWLREADAVFGLPPSALAEKAAGATNTRLATIANHACASTALVIQICFPCLPWKAYSGLRLHNTGFRQSGDQPGA